MVKNLKPFMNIGPGDILQEELDARGWRQEDLAEILGMSLKSVNQLIKNKQSITIETAKLLGSAFDVSPQFWLNLDTNYRLRLQNNGNTQKDVEIKSLIYSYMPVKEMVEKGWLDKWNSTNELIGQVKDFWDIKKLDFSFLEKTQLPSLRKSDAYRQFNKYYALTWFKMAQHGAKKFTVPKYSRKKLETITKQFHRYTMLKTGVTNLINDLNNVGIKFFVLPHLQKTYIDGASFWDKSNPVIVYTMRYDRIDNFWFTVAHEIGHIEKHLKNKSDFFIDNLDYITTDKEKEANEYASLLLKVQEILEYFAPYEKYVSEVRVVNCSIELGVHPAVIVGVLQHYEKLPRRNLNRLKEAVSDKIPNKYMLDD